MWNLFTGLVVSAAACLATGAAGALDVPPRRAGLWEMKMVFEGRNVPRTTFLPIYRCPSDVGPERWTMTDEDGNALAQMATGNYVGVFGVSDCDDCVEGTAADWPFPTRYPQCGGEGVFYHNSTIRFAEITDGLSNTFMVGEHKTAPIFDPPWFSTWAGVVPDGADAIVRILGTTDHTPNNPVNHIDDFSSHHVGGAHFLFGDGAVRFINANVDLKHYQGMATRGGGEIIGEF
jgi:hypothetical protein